MHKHFFGFLSVLIAVGSLSACGGNDGDWQTLRPNGFVDASSGSVDPVSPGSIQGYAGDGSAASGAMGMTLVPSKMETPVVLAPAALSLASMAGTWKVTSMVVKDAKTGDSASMLQDGQDMRLAFQQDGQWQFQMGDGGKPMAINQAAIVDDHQIQVDHFQNTPFAVEMEGTSMTWTGMPFDKTDTVLDIACQKISDTATLSNTGS